MDSLYSLVTWNRYIVRSIRPIFRLVYLVYLVRPIRLAYP